VWRGLVAPGVFGGVANGEVNVNGVVPAPEEEDPPLPPGFPAEEDFDGLLCYKCVNAVPWIKRYAGTEGFLPPVHHSPPTGEQPTTSPAMAPALDTESRKRKAEDDDEKADSSSAKRHRSSSQPPTTIAQPTPEASSALKPDETHTASATAPSPPACLYTALPPSPSGTFSILLHPTFRDHFCRCPMHFPLLSQHPQLLDEEETYEPPISESSEGGPQSAGSKSLLDRGEAALSNIDRVRAIEGVMVYNHLRDKVKDFLKPFADSGKAVGAEDIKAYFETLRGDAEAMKAAKKQQMEAGGEEGAEGDGRREQGGY
jgi:E3 ubiquitin-protein ligase UBR7